MTSINRWVKFFREAGIHDESAATYADNFYKNKMDMTMLMDLNKDYLNDLGIETLGDVIKVTKHAKKVSEKMNSDRILSDSSKDKEDSPPATKYKKSRLKENTDQPPTSDEESPPPSRKRKLAIKSESDNKPVSSVKQESGIKASRLSSDDKYTTSMKHEPGTRGSRVSSGEEKTSVFTRLGDTEVDTKSEAKKKNVFDRLEPVKLENDSLDVDSKKPSTRIVTSSGPPPTVSVTSRPAPNSNIVSTRPLASSKQTKLLVKEEPKSAFDRLDSKADTQVPKVSSTNESHTPEPGKGILKQRKPGLVKSKSTSSIISLKSRESNGSTIVGQKKRSTRVSFGENDYRAVSPRQGIKTRLWGGSDVETVDTSDDDIEELQDVKFNRAIQAARVDDLRLNIKKKQEAKLGTSQVNTEGFVGSDNNKNVKVRLTNTVQESQLKVANKTKEEGNNVKPAKAKSKKVYVVQSTSDGQKIRTEIPPSDPRYLQYMKSGVKKPEERSKLEKSEEAASNPLASRLGAQKPKRPVWTRQDNGQESEKQPSVLSSRPESRLPDSRTSLASRLEPHPSESRTLMDSRLKPRLSESRTPMASRLEPRLPESRNDMASRLEPRLPEPRTAIASRLEPPLPEPRTSVASRLEPRLSEPRASLSSRLESRDDMSHRDIHEINHIDIDRVERVGNRGRMMIDSLEGEMSSIQIHRDSKFGEYHTLEARATRISADRDEEDFVSSRLSDRQESRAVDQRFTVRVGDTEVYRRSEDDAIEREIARKEQNICMIENRISKTMSRAMSDSSLTSTSNIQDHRSRFDQAQYSRNRRQESEDRQLVAASRRGTMIADREQQRPAIEDRLSAKQVVQPSLEERLHADRHGFRDRSRSPVPMETAARWGAGEGDERMRRGGEEGWGRRGEDARGRREDDVRGGNGRFDAGKTSVRNRLGYKI